MKIHLGCNKKYLPDWIHIDIEKFSHVDFVTDARNLSSVVEKETASELYACHILEHFSRFEIGTVLKEWASVIQLGGTIRLSVPDLEAVFNHYDENKNLRVLTGLLWGGQRNEYDYHKIGFDFKTLKEELEKAGFGDVKRYDWRDFLPDTFDDYSRSYLPHMDFEKGKLMSLNVIATKIIR